jgi:putative FmdB family regulatory protein
MPMFEYTCNDCGKKFEELVSSENETVECPACHSPNARKLLSVFAASAGSGSSGATPCGAPSCGRGFS